MEKVCRRCNQIYADAESSFFKDKKRKDGYQPYCRACQREMQRESRKANKGKIKIEKVKIEGYKTCSKCNAVKPLTSEYFNASKSQPDGFHSYCKECQKEYWNKYFLDKRSELKSKRKERYEGNREVEIKRAKDYQERNPDKVKVYKKKHSAKQAEHIRQRVQKWKEKNPIHARMLKHIKRAENIDITLEGFIELYKKYEVSENIYQCHYCGEEMTFAETTIDHFIPLSKGGQNALANLVISCWTCNMKKGSKVIEEK